MNFNQALFCIRILALSLIGAVATEAQQPQVAEPDALVTATRSSVPTQQLTSAVPHEIKFTGVLKDSSGKPLAGIVSLAFALYDQQEGGTASWSETQNVELDIQGHYSVLLGAASSSGMPPELFRSTEGHWLGVRVVAPGQTEQPRVRWVSVPFALKAGDAETLGGRPASSYVVNPDAQLGSKSAASPTPLATTVTGTGTAGFISKFLTSTTLGNSVIFEKTGNIGLGTTSPVAKLSVVGNVSATGTFIGNLTGNATSASKFTGTLAGEVTGTEAKTVVSNAVITNTANAIVRRDASGSFSAGSITLNRNFALPQTSIGGSVGVISFGGLPFLHNFGGSTFVGTNAGNTSMTGGENVAVGQYALSHNTSGSLDNAIGSLALGSNTSGSSNNAVGELTLAGNTTGSNNNAFGESALGSNSAGSNNNAFGAGALLNNLASFNSAFGDSALTTNTTGFNNNAFGALALGSNTTGASNSAFGFQALNTNTTGQYNSAFGLSALQANTDGDQNSAFGDGALASNTRGSNNVAVGYSAYGNLSSGNANIAIGPFAGIRLAAGDSNIYIGNEGPNIYLGSESNTIRIGNTNSPAGITFIAGINGATSASGVPVFINSSGQLGTITSSQRFKNDITDMDTESDLLMQLRPVSFYYKPELDDTHTRQYGLVAEEVAKIAPQLVVFDKDGAPQTVRYHFVNAMLLNEVQKQRRLVEEQQQTIAQQQATLQDLAARLAKLEAAGHEQ